MMYVITEVGCPDSYWDAYDAIETIGRLGHPIQDMNHVRGFCTKEAARIYLQELKAFDNDLCYADYNIEPYVVWEKRVWDKYLARSEKEREQIRASYKDDIPPMQYD